MSFDAKQKANPVEPDPNPTKPPFPMQAISIVFLALMLATIFLGRFWGSTTRLLLTLGLLGLYYAANAWWKKRYMGLLPPETQENIRLAERRGTRGGIWIGLFWGLFLLVFTYLMIRH